MQEPVKMLAAQRESFERSRPLCPDHRDKQREGVCLACRAEQAEAATEQARAENLRLYDGIALLEGQLEQSQRRAQEAEAERDIIHRAHHLDFAGLCGVCQDVRDSAPAEPPKALPQPLGTRADYCGVDLEDGFWCGKFSPCTIHTAEPHVCGCGSRHCDAPAEPEPPAEVRGETHAFEAPQWRDHRLGFKPCRRIAGRGFCLKPESDPVHAVPKPEPPKGERSR